MKYDSVPFSNYRIIDAIPTGPPLEGLYSPRGSVTRGCLGVMNTWNAINQRRVRLRIRPTHAFTSNGTRMFCIEVINLSTFPVTISEVGFSTRRWINRGSRLVVVAPVIIDAKPWPRRLESRESVSAYFSPDDVLGQLKPISRAYAQTSCGEVAYGMSPALGSKLDQWIDTLWQIRFKAPIGRLEWLQRDFG